LQQIRRYGFDAAILFADILLVPHALGADLWIVTGEGSSLSTVTTVAELAALKPADGANDALAPVYETIRILSRALPARNTLIGFAGAPWTIATYMIAGQGTPDQEPAHALKVENRAVFNGLIDWITQATIVYLSAEIEAGAEVAKPFDSRAGSLQGEDFMRYSIEPMRCITATVKAEYPQISVIAFPRGAEGRYTGLHAMIGADCIAMDDGVTADWAAKNVQTKGCVQGNLASSNMVSGGAELVSETRHIVDALGAGPHIFNLGHGITPGCEPGQCAAYDRDGTRHVKRARRYGRALS